MNKATNIKSFEGDLAKITEIQTSFLKEAKDFVYFRKGEFDNIVEMLLVLINHVLSNPKIIIASVAAYPGAKAIVSDIIKGVKKIEQFAKDRKEKNELTFRVISIKTDKNRKELKEFEEKGVGVCEIPEEKSGRLRFFVNEKRFCLFVRQEENDFFGMIGTDKLMIRRLRELFDREYTENKT